MLSERRRSRRISPRMNERVTLDDIARAVHVSRFTWRAYFSNRQACRFIVI